MSRVFLLLAFGCLAPVGCNAILGNGSGEFEASSGESTGSGLVGTGASGSGSAGAAGSEDGGSGGSVGEGGGSIDAAAGSAVDRDRDARPDAASTRDAGQNDVVATVDASDAGASLDASAGPKDAARDGPVDALSDRPPLNPAAVLEGQRWDLPCGPMVPDNQVCQDLPVNTTMCPPDPGSRTVNRTLTFGGTPNTFYDVELRFRGVVEPKIYEGGTEWGQHLYVGGVPALHEDGTKSQYNVYSLTVSSPANVYYFNFDEHMGETRYVFPVDIRHVVTIEGGARVTLASMDLDCVMIRNCVDVTVQPCTPYVIAGVPPASGYNGQFLLINVLSVTPK
jgi:hypothetical protein